MKAKPSSPRHPARHSARHSPRNGSRVASRGSTKPVTRRYCHHDQVSPNKIRLWAIVRLFKLSPSDVAKACGVSRPYIARLLSPNDNLRGSPEFFRVLEAKLGKLIDNRSAQYFTVPAVSVGRVRAVLELVEAA